MSFHCDYQTLVLVFDFLYIWTEVASLLTLKRRTLFTYTVKEIECENLWILVKVKVNNR